MQIKVYWLSVFYILCVGLQNTLRSTRIGINPHKKASIVIGVLSCDFCSHKSEFLLEFIFLCSIIDQLFCTIFDFLTFFIFLGFETLITCILTLCVHRKSSLVYHAIIWIVWNHGSNDLDFGFFDTIISPSSYFHL